MFIFCENEVIKEGEVTASFKKGYTHYARVEEITNNKKNVINFELYSIPDSLGYLYSNRDSLLKSAVGGNVQSLKILRDNNLDEDFTIDIGNFTKLRSYIFKVPSEDYRHNLEKVIWNEEGGNSIYLPNISIAVHY